MTTKQQGTLQEGRNGQAGLAPTSGRSPLEDSVFRMYGKLAIGQNDVCRRCHESVGEGTLRGPVSIWHVGNRFGEDDQRILFAGKTARDGIYEDEENGVDDVTSWFELAISNDEPRHAGSWAFWSYTREIIEKVYGSLAEGRERIAFSNLLKCNCSNTTDKSSTAMKTCCLRGLGVFRREVQLIQPRNIVLYTGKAYDDYLEDLLPEGWRILRETDRNQTHRCGKKDLPWWEAEVWQDGVLKCRVLRTGHPERKKRVDFVRMVVEWLRKSC